MSIHMLLDRMMTGDLWLWPWYVQGGIELADRVVTVSPSYRDEILTPEGGWGLQETCRSRCVSSPRICIVIYCSSRFGAHARTDMEMKDSEI